MAAPSLQDVRSFWEHNPLCASAIPHPAGSAEYFRAYDALRETNEPPAFSARLHEYASFAGKLVLDVGAGNGYVLSRYAQAGARVFGIDLTRSALDLCRRRFALEGRRGSFLQASAENLPFPDASFDCGCSMGVLHHTPDTARAVAEVRRVLRPGGRLILMLYHRHSALYRWRFPVMALLTGRSRQELVNEVDGAGNPKGEVYSKDELLGLLAGFHDRELFAGLLQPWMLPPPLHRLVPAAFARRLERRWGWFLYAKARKD